MRIILYILGCLLLLGAACYVASFYLDPVWVGVIGMVILGLGLMGAARVGSRRVIGDGTGTSTVINKVD
jgi:hypothetical protein